MCVFFFSAVASFCFVRFNVWPSRVCFCLGFLCLFVLYAFYFSSFFCVLGPAVVAFGFTEEAETTSGPGLGAEGSGLQGMQRAAAEGLWATEGRPAGLRAEVLAGSQQPCCQGRTFFHCLLLK